MKCFERFFDDTRMDAAIFGGDCYVYITVALNSPKPSRYD